MSRLVVCACGCGANFIEEPRVGRPREYLNERHSQRDKQRRYRLNKREGVLAGLSKTGRCTRRYPRSREAALKAFNRHCDHGTKAALNCVQADPVQYRCPAVVQKDPQFCLVYATLYDDYMELALPGRYTRERTTDDGLWL
ncbi:hypothetical protein LCGC14_0410210 [marine sediment metagenome]|uniref:Uncharacterized protein n=1 Tax=marine sediment metagenome TaxID=412755 RepID=A0A0F9TC43_9ZZZZ